MTVPSLTDARCELDEFLLALDPHGERPDDQIVREAIGEENCYRPLTLGTLKRLLFDTEPQEATTSPARRGDPSTSHEAAKVAAITAHGARGRLLLTYAKNRIRGWDGYTAEAAVNVSGLGNQRSPWKRVSELKAAGLIEPTGVQKETGRGTHAEVLAITEAGMETLRRTLPSELAEITAAVG